MKKILLFFVALMCCAKVFADDFEVDGIYYNHLGGDSVEVTSGSNKYSSSVTILNEVTYNSTTYRITAIGNSAFYNCSSLTAITIPNSVTTIGNSAFYNCSSLTEITIPNSVIAIGYYVFYGCNSLIDITIGKNVTTIGTSLFYGCKALEVITMDADNPLYKSVNNCLIAKRSKQLICGCKGSVIPADGSVTTIGEYAFYGTGIISLNIPEAITTIGLYAFAESDLTEITISSRISTISNRTFHKCSKLTEIIIPNSVTSIGSDAFSDCTNLTTIIIPDSVTSIGNYAFGRCSSLTTITIPNSVTSIGDGAFRDCSALEKVNYMGTIASWCNISFYSNPLSNGVDFYLNDVKLTDLIIPQGRSSIGSWFSGCTSLQTVSIPSSVSYIKSKAFAGCTSLQSATIKCATPPSIESNAFPSYNVRIIVPCSSTEQYWENTEWGKYLYYEEDVLFDLNVESIDKIQGTVTIVQSPTSCENPEAIIKATPTEHHQFVKWSDGVTTVERKVNITQDTVFTAEFAPIMFTITASANADVYGSVTGGAEYQEGDIATLIATANEGYEFKQWICGEDTYETATISFTVETNADYMAIFAVKSATAALENVHDAECGVRKVLENGTIYILRNGKKYTIDGRKVE